MPNIDDIFKSKTWKGTEIDKPVYLTITECRTHEFDDGTKLVLSFKEDERGLVCNKTNALTIADGYGRDTDNWIGKPLKLFKARVTYQGRMTDAVRVACDPRHTGAAEPPPTAPEPEPEDDLPF
jgi:hypothetical protein